MRERSGGGVEPGARGSSKDYLHRFAAFAYETEGFSFCFAIAFLKITRWRIRKNCIKKRNFRWSGEQINRWNVTFFSYSFLDPHYYSCL